MLTRDDLQKFAPRPQSGDKAATWDAYVKALEEHAGALCAEFGIDTALELQHFMAQIAHESGGFTVLWESGAYSSQGIMNTFGVGKHTSRVTKAEADQIAAMPVAKRGAVLFERVYGLGIPHCCKSPDDCQKPKQACKARELGNNQPGDGYRYRGFGPMQITGRADHEKYLNGDSSPYAALRGAFAEWDAKGCNELAARDDIKSITKRINGGYNGLEDRKLYLAKAKRIWPLFPGVDAPDLTIAEAKQVSGKAKAADIAQKVAVTTVATGTVVQVADWIAQATEQITSINALTTALATTAAFVKAHAVLALIVGAILVWWFGRHIIRKVIADFREGRYKPKVLP